MELLSPTGTEGAIAKFLEKRGGGMHHVAFHAKDIKAEMERLRGLGRPPLEVEPRPGAKGHSVCFVHPKHTGGTLVELVAESKGGT